MDNYNLFQTLSLRPLQTAARTKMWTFQGKAAFSSLASDVTLDNVELKSAPLTTLSEEEEMMRDTGIALIFLPEFSHKI